jgi:arylsulfatase A-like enzyme
VPTGENQSLPEPALIESPGTLLATAVGFGIVAGFGEGLGLLIFQRINWAQWARVMHVSKEILWISPLVDLAFFLLIGLSALALCRVFPRVSALRVLVFLLALLTAYDWLMVTGRLYRRASLLLAFGVAVALSRWLRTREGAAARFWRRSISLLVATLLLVIAAIQGGKWLSEHHVISNLPTAPLGSPNVLVIVLDTLRADHLSSYGYLRATTPEIDKVAGQGVLFENAIAPSSWSLPSHASLVTGRPVHEHGLGNVQPMPWLGWDKSSLNGLPTLGEALQRKGYRTGAFSANRVYFTSNVGLGRGFIHFEDYFYSVGDSFLRTQFGREFARLCMNRSSKSKFTRAFRALGLGSWLDKDSEGSGDYGGVYGVRKRASEVNREALRWVERDRHHPFFAFLTYLDVHYAYGGPADYPKPGWDRGTAIDEYDAGLKYDDDCIGQLLRQLDQLGILKNTIIVITSDHGEGLGDHGLTYHGAALYRELMRVPLIISYPGHVAERVRVPRPVANTEIASTIMDLIGGDGNPFPGPSLSSLWSKSAPADWPNPVSELPATNTVVAADRMMQGKIPIATDGWMKSVVTPRWHLIAHQKHGEQLYDWQADPDELKDLAKTPEGHDVLPSLRRDF